MPTSKRRPARSVRITDEMMERVAVSASHTEFEGNLMLDLRDERNRSAWLLEKLREMNHLHATTRRELAGACGTSDPAEAAKRFRYLLNHARSLYGTVKKHERWIELINGRKTMISVIVRLSRREKMWRGNVRRMMELLNLAGIDRRSTEYALMKRKIEAELSFLDWSEFLSKEGIQQGGDDL